MTAVPSESAEQQAVIEWARAMTSAFPALRLLFATQAGARVSWTQAKKLKREGMQAGVPDLCLPVPRGGYHGLWIELKRAKGGRLSAPQAWWLVHLEAHGYRALVCRGATEAIAELHAYLTNARISHAEPI